MSVVGSPRVPLTGDYACSSRRAPAASSPSLVHTQATVITGRYGAGCRRTGSMRRVSAGLVGSAESRAVHGWSFGADCAVLSSSTDRADAGSAGSLDDVAKTASVDSSDESPDRDGVSKPSTGNVAAASGAVTAPEQILPQVCHPDELATTSSLAELADLAERGSGPLVVADARLRLSLPGYLDLVDVPDDSTAALLADPYQIEAPRRQFTGIGHATLARVGREEGAIEAGGSFRHTVTDPNRIVVGLLRISAADRGAAARLWRDIAERRTSDRTGPESTPPTPFDLALLALVRGGVRVVDRPLGYYSWSRRGVAMAGIGHSGWQQRLRSASRLGDGAYSTAVIRPLSRLITRAGLRLNITPNTLTAVSLAVGVGTALLIMTGSMWAGIAAAFGLQLALVIDCSDGEVARFTRRYSSVGGWLDGIGDRVKEYLVFAALAMVAARGQIADSWVLAIVAMTVITARHLEDHAYHDRADAMAPPLRGEAAVGDNPRYVLSGPASSGARRRFWLKKIAHVPIGERYLTLSIGLLTGRPMLTLIAAIAVSGFALGWTVGGRLLAALKQARRQIGADSDADGLRTRRPPTSVTGPGTLDHQLDLGVLSRVLALRRAPFLPGTLITLGLWILVAAGVWMGPGGVAAVLAPAAAIAALPMLASSWQPPVLHRLGWLTLPVIWIFETAVITGTRAYHVPGALLFIVVAVVCYRRYELIYSIRLLGRRQQRCGVLGADGRILLVAVGALLASWVAAAAGVSSDDLACWVLVVLAGETMAEAVWSTVTHWRTYRWQTASEEERIQT